MGVKVRSHLQKLRETAERDPAASTSAVVTQVLGGVQSEAVRGRLPSMELMRQGVRKFRARHEIPVPADPERREDLVIPERLTVSIASLRKNSHAWS